MSEGTYATNQTCVVSCLFGVKFSVVYKAPRHVPSYFFTNNPTLKQEIEKKGWQYIYIDFQLIDDSVESSMQSKYIKFLQFLKEEVFAYFNTYTHIVYVDHKLQLKDKHIVYLLSQQNEKYILLRDHSTKRNTIWEEVGQAMFYEKYLKFMPQTIDYIREKIKEGYSEKPYVCTTGLVLYNHHEDKVKKLVDEVYRDILKIGTPECQIVWAMVAQKYMDIIGILPWDSVNIKWDIPAEGIEGIKNTAKKMLKLWIPLGFVIEYRKICKRIQNARHPYRHLVQS